MRVAGRDIVSPSGQMGQSPRSGPTVRIVGALVGPPPIGAQPHFSEYNISRNGHSSFTAPALSSRAASNNAHVVKSTGTEITPAGISITVSGRVISSPGAQILVQSAPSCVCVVGSMVSTVATGELVGTVSMVGVGVRAVGSDVGRAGTGVGAAVVAVVGTLVVGSVVLAGKTGHQE